MGKPMSCDENYHTKEYDLNSKYGLEAGAAAPNIQPIHA
jgi:hypothetical protein